MYDSVISMLRHPREVHEFSLACQVILPIMADPKETRDIKRATLNMMVSELSDKTFSLKSVAKQIMTIINMKQDACEEYVDSNAQTDGILEWLPRMKEHRGILLEEVKRHREEYRLNI